MSWTITKLTGAGNSFLLADLSKIKGSTLSPAQMKKITVKMCDPHFGIGADGFVFLKKLGTNKYKWDFYNSDGSLAEMCGNATRCVARYLQLKPGKTNISLKTRAGEVQLSSPKKDVFESQLSIKLDQNFSIQELKVSVDGQSVQGLFMDTGVPHFCIQVGPDDYKALDKINSRKLQLAKEFQPRQTNVTYWAVKSANSILASSFERGVHDFTLACGTGAAAAALAFFEVAADKKKVSVQMPGGLLQVRKEDEKLYLSGPAVKVADIKVDERI